ncbi:MAG: hypothetical protein AAB428_02410 [Patescibacteria group bacterium]
MVPTKFGEVKLWGFFQGLSRVLYRAKRLDEKTIMFEFEGKIYNVGFPQKAEEHAALVGFDGFFLRHGLAGGAKVLEYKYGDNGDNGQEKGPEHIEICSNLSNVRHISEYEDEDSRTKPDYYLAPGEGISRVARALHHRSIRHFILAPKSKNGSRSLFCQLKPRSLERRYIMIVATYSEIQLITCNSY